VVVNVPNILTVLRILLAPLFVILLLKEMPGYALVVFSIAGISDGLDGFIARYTNQRTVLGSYLDPLADKLLLITAYVSLAVLHLIPSWLSVLVICRDVIILIGIAVFSITGVPVSIKPSIPSKCTTVFQLATIFFSLLNSSLSFQPLLFQTLIWITAGLTIFSGLHYIFLGLGILQNGGKSSRQKTRI
jgi:cardiolipin synthase